MANPVFVLRYIDKYLTSGEFFSHLINFRSHKLSSRLVN